MSWDPRKHPRGPEGRFISKRGSGKLENRRANLKNSVVIAGRTVTKGSVSGRLGARKSVTSGMPAQLRVSYLKGKVADRIGWGKKGDFTRCVAQAKAHGMSEGTARGVCANLHKQATGIWPGDKRNIEGTKFRR